MQFGIIFPANQEHPRTSGFDYVEADATQLLHPEIPADQWTPPPASILPLQALHSLIPATMPITGPDVDLPALRLYVQSACERAAQIGVRLINLSSAAAFRLPDGFDPKQAKSQILDFLRTALPFFARHELMLVAGVNPPTACNVMTTLPEVLQYIWQVDHPWFQCLLDVSLIPVGQITLEHLTDALPWIRHVQVSTTTPDLIPIFAKLKQTNYQDCITLASADSLASVKEAWQSAPHQ